MLATISILATLRIFATASILVLNSVDRGARAERFQRAGAGLRAAVAGPVCPGREPRMLVKDWNQKRTHAQGQVVFR